MRADSACERRIKAAVGRRIISTATMAAGMAVCLALLWLLYAYVFLWGNVPNISRLFGNGG